MRNHFWIALAAVALFSVLPFLPPPAGPSEAFALDDPAMPDGGSIVGCTDGGTLVTADTGRTSAWASAIRCEGVSARYTFCEYNIARCCAFEPDGGFFGPDGGWDYDGGQNLGQGSCSATTANQWLNNDITYDINVPANRRFVSFLFGAATDANDGGQPGCHIQAVTP